MNSFVKVALKFRLEFWAKVRAGFHPTFSFYHSNSQFGEDMVIRSLLGNAQRGFYVDIGSFHPVYYSNTYYFYCRGWRGINVDANPRNLELFKILRPRDINIEACIYPQSDSIVTFYDFDNPAFNTCDPAMAQNALAKGVRLIAKRSLNTITFTECLDRYVPEGFKIDLLSIDVEGLDEQILETNDWERYRPRILVFERHDVSLTEFAGLSLNSNLEYNGYTLMAKCGPSFIYARQ